MKEKIDKVYFHLKAVFDILNIFGEKVDKPEGEKTRGKGKRPLEK